MIFYERIGTLILALLAAPVISAIEWFTGRDLLDD